jgi:hypothetical protein
MNSENKYPYHDLNYIDNNKLPSKFQHFIKQKKDEINLTDFDPNRHNSYVHALLIMTITLKEELVVFKI